MYIYRDKLEVTENYGDLQNCVSNIIRPVKI